MKNISTSLQEIEGQLVGEGKTTPSHYRDERIDSIKFCLIILVVIVHILEMWHLFPELYIFINTLVMPVFVFISGYFSKPKRLSSFVKSNKKIIWVFILTHLFVCLTGDRIMYYCFGYGGNPWITPWFALWYIFALLLWRLSLVIVKPQLRIFHLLLVFLLAILIGFVPIECEFSLIRAVSFYPFFYVGVALHGKDLKTMINKIPISVSIFILIVTAIFCCIIPITPITPYMPSTHYASSLHCATRTFWMFAAFPIGAAFLRTCPSNRIFALLGKHTLSLYIAHMFILNFILYYL